MVSPAQHTRKVLFSGAICMVFVDWPDLAVMASQGLRQTIEAAVISFCLAPSMPPGPLLAGKTA